MFCCNTCTPAHNIHQIHQPVPRDQVTNSRCPQIKL
ncbi:hypothetical protein E2C01_087396 [Portunus trituberculatus]|uniref:Uncharacterized protein n=1 Tax=Portunus trituberculatus TaxID=210409 RepID=A0A5B7JJ45_PORTR|nr:hypothetical protein [Portunus trituberculatus]